MLTADPRSTSQQQVLRGELFAQSKSSLLALLVWRLVVMSWQKSGFCNFTVKFAEITETFADGAAAQGQ